MADEDASQPGLRMLAVMGLTPSEEAVYLALLTLPPATVKDVCEACAELDHAAIRAALDSLTDRGLLTRLPQAPRRYTPVPPEMVLGTQLLQREEELNRARAIVADLSQRYRAISRHSSVDGLVEIVTGKRQALQRWSGALRAATSQVRVLDRPLFGNDTPNPSPEERGLLKRGVQVKVIYDESGAHAPEVIAARRAKIAAGEQARMFSGVPVHVLLVDDRMALMPVRQDEPGTGALLVVHPCAVLDGLSALFEMVWSDALPLAFDGAVPVARAALPLRNATTNTVLGLLSAGLSDQAIARRLGCSERTVQRHVQRLMDAAGAKTRFQAGLQIGRRGHSELTAVCVAPDSASADTSERQAANGRPESGTILAHRPAPGFFTTAAGL